MEASIVFPVPQLVTTALLILRFIVQLRRDLKLTEDRGYSIATTLTMNAMAHWILYCGGWYDSVVIK
jgi:hypothetical protein